MRSMSLKRLASWKSISRICGACCGRGLNWRRRRPRWRSVGWILRSGNILEALTSGDPRRRMASAMFTVRYSAKARKRGCITNSSASVDANAVADAQPKHYRVVWGKPDEPDRELGPGEFRRDGRILSAPDYGGDDSDADQRDDVVEGELAPPATMIGHETAAVEEPEPTAVEAIEPVPPPAAPESAAARYERERVAAWVRARLTPYPMDRCCYCRLPFNFGQQWQEVANDAVRVRFPRRVRRRGMACRAGSCGAAGAGARGLNLSEDREYARCRRCPRGPSPPLVAHLYAPYVPPPRVAPARPRR